MAFSSNLQPVKAIVAMRMRVLMRMFRLIIICSVVDFIYVVPCTLTFVTVQTPPQPSPDKGGSRRLVNEGAVSSPNWGG